MNAHYRKAHPNRPRKPRTPKAEKYLPLKIKQYPPHGQEVEILAEIEEHINRLESLMHELNKVKRMGL
jgi:hypothetical protein